MLKKSVSSILIWPTLLLGITPISFYHINSIFTSPDFYRLKYRHFEKCYFHMFLLGFRRKLSALTLCKSIKSAIQWFQIHHRITFATIPNPAVYLSSARVSIFSTLVPRLIAMQAFQDVYHNIFSGKKFLGYGMACFGLWSNGGHLGFSNTTCVFEYFFFYAPGEFLYRKGPLHHALSTCL